MVKKITILLAILGLLMGVYSVATSKPKIEAPPLAQPPSVNPFPHGIAALGLVESGSRDVEIGAPDSGLVTDVMAEVGDRVQKGQPLFQLDDRTMKSELIRARAALASAEAEVKRLEGWPRPEDFPPVEAEVAEAQSRLADARTRLSNMERASALAGASPDEMERQRYAVEAAEAVLRNAQSRLERLKSGAWTEDLAVARAGADQRRAEIEAINIRLERLTVRSPVAGTILRRNIKAGEFIASGVGDPPMIVGDLATLHVRAQVDEEDAPILRAGAAAKCKLRGPVADMIDLRMIRIEPFARPKAQITGSNTERIDTRVVEAVFEVAVKEHPPMYPGQVVDVYIETEPATQ
ncbi:MAG TPA: HlyD family efflux transporter periplasmic adaptor subunit [Phycisphaerales bacterium]|nr:HlyD family efflux transporter periplasmic adaptor subunit [Phycisphaerales bacterium]